MDGNQAKDLTAGGYDKLEKPVRWLVQRKTLCPLTGCRGCLNPYPTRQSSYDAVTGLDHLVCPLCGHRGMRVPSGLHLIFRGPNEYVFQYPPSLATLTIAASQDALARFTQHSVAQAQALTFMATWVLLTGRATGLVRFAVGRAVFEDCYNYFRRCILHERRAQVA
jgi:hypothetical protein